MKDYSVVITSCGRFDLLDRTLRSLVPRLDRPPEAFIVIEDSGDEAVRDVVSPIVPEAIVLVNERQIGQLASIDRAYRFVHTPLVFHCEDDWMFHAGEFLEDSATLLDEFDALSLISLRSREELNPLVRRSPVRRCDGVDFFRADPTLHPEYFGYSFNPGLRRMSDYRRIGPFASFSGERQISYCFKKLGYTMGYLENPCVTHLGGKRHVDDPNVPRRPRNLRQRLIHSGRLRVERLRRTLLPAADPAVQIQRGMGMFAATRIAQLDAMHVPCEMVLSASQRRAETSQRTAAHQHLQADTTKSNQVTLTSVAHSSEAE